MQRFLLFLSILIIKLSSFCQAPIGGWTYYGSYNNMEVLEEVGNRIYVANEKGAFYVVDSKSHETKKLTKMDGFVDARVTYLEYSASEGILVIGYINGQIDLLKGNQILNVNDIFRNENISSSKRINHITILKETAYLSTDFGVVLLDITTGLIIETYRFIGSGGSEVQVFSSTIKVKTDSLFIVSSEGLQTASLYKYNLQDFHNWTTHDVNNQIPMEALVDVATLNDTVYLASINGLYTLEGQLWEARLEVINEVSSLTEGTDDLILCYADSVLKVKFKSGFESVVSPLLLKASMARVGSEGTVYVTDSLNGLVVIGGTSNRYFPSGPQYSDAFRIKFFNNKVTVLSGGYSSSVSAENSKRGFYDYQLLTWTNYTSGTGFPFMKDFVSAASNTITGLSYYASFGNGLLVNSGNTYELLNEKNSLLDTASDGKVYVVDIKVADDGDMWLTNYTFNSSDFDKSIYKIDKDGVWKGYQTANSVGRSAMEFIIDKDQVKWFQVRESASIKSLLVFDPETANEKLLTQKSGGLPGSVNCLDINKKGEIFIGTDEGIAVVYNSQEVFSSNSFSVTLPILGEQFLLNGETIKAIKIDGGGRLWVGTTTGLFLFNEDLSEQLAYYTTKNSPLLHNEISAIEIDGNTGEVFFSTEDGVFSYMGEATDATEKNKDNIVIFPNPVYPEYSGVVAIRGLVSEANVKITDINTNLVYETQALGGTANWDVRLLSGERAATGVYLVFTSDEEGKETFIGKIAVISE